MAPPTPTLPLSTLEKTLNTLPNGKQRNPPIALTDCALKELVQYKCNVVPPKKPGQKVEVVCEPVVRLLRMCENGLSVETTAWEGWNAKQAAGKEGTANNV